ncbi:unnamed protein product [marine sediment metagenome]|uniref:Uncharacterized protein n=1 Tax=marine sediment metagenome TaxID=412755 RepID=X1APW5_9ZZZZ
MLLEDKVGIITGGAKGIGKAICELFNLEGAYLSIVDIAFDEAKKVAEEISNKTGRRCIAISANVSKKAEVEKMVKNTVEYFGKVDILVNNAGILIHKFFLEMSEEDWDNIISVNLKSVFLCSQAVAREMIKQKSGKIINVSSLSAKKPTIKEAAYSASKAGILGLNRVMALELGRYGINVNAICPGFTETEMSRKAWLTKPDVINEWIDKTALKKIGKPEDQAKVALFLASHLSDYITGEAIIVSAGEVMGQ